MIGRYKEGFSTPLKGAVHEDKQGSWTFYYNKRSQVTLSLVAIIDCGVYEFEPTKLAIKKKVLELGRKWHDSKTWRQAFDDLNQGNKMENQLDKSWEARDKKQDPDDYAQIYYVQGASDFQQRAIEELNKEAGMESDEYLGLIKAIELIKTLKAG